MITSLTAEQEALFPQYVKKWTDVGTDTGRLDPAVTEKIVHDFQALVLDRKTTPVVIVENPIEAWIACNYAVLGSAPEELHDRLKEYFTAVDEKPIQVASPVFPYQEGSFSTAIFSYYDYIIRELKLPLDAALMRKYEAWEATCQLGFIYPLENVCIVSQKPSSIKLDDEHRLHCDGGPALTYNGYGDFAIYSLHGVTVEKYLAETPGEQLSLDYYHTITNADQRTEFVRKYGVERMLDLGKKIDSHESYDQEWWTKSEYELWDMACLFEGVAYAPHLKMLNQTTGIWHVEAVSPHCENLAQAINDRMGDFNIINIK